MTVSRLAYAVVFFVLGLGVGVLWSPLGNRAVSHIQAENDKYVAQMREMFGDGAAEFARQFEDMTIRINEFPIDAHASPDGRFVIRLFGSDETIASEVRDPDSAGGVMKWLVRTYSFSHGDRTYSCNFVRDIDDSEMKSVTFHITDSNGTDLTYKDNDADGRWDGFSDCIQDTSKNYVRDGLCWKKCEKTAPPGEEETVKYGDGVGSGLDR